MAEQVAVVAQQVETRESNFEDVRDDLRLAESEVHHIASAINASVVKAKRDRNKRIRADELRWEAVATLIPNLMPYALCLVPYALCLMPYALCLCLMPYALCPILIP